MSNFLVNAGPATAAVLGILAFIFGLNPHGEALLLTSSIYFGSAIIAAQLARLSEKGSD